MNRENQKKYLILLLMGTAVCLIFMISHMAGAGARPEYAPLIHPGDGHILGTDNSGRDIFFLLIESGRTSIFIGLGAALFATAVGAFIGCSAGYLGSPVADPLMRLTDVFLLIPTLPLIIVLSAYFGPGMFNVTLIISMTAWPATARIIHAHVLGLRSQVFITNTKSMGAGTLYIIMRHILPNCSELLLAKAALTAAGAMLAEAGISFLGLGDPMHSSWGSMLHDAFLGAALMNGYIWWYLPPVCGISLSVILFSWAGHSLSGSDQLNGPVISSTHLSFSDPPGTTGSQPSPFLSIKDLHVKFKDLTGRTRQAVNGLNLDLQHGEKAAVIGETGSGKSLLLLSILGFLPDGATAGGAISVNGRMISDFSLNELRNYRQTVAAYIPQGLGNALNPVLTIGYQVGERARMGQGGAKADQAALQALSKAGFPHPEPLILQYPHHLSGGMKQRVLSAMALSGSPDLILADEPTKGLDPEAVQQTVKLFSGLESVSVLAVTHDLTFARALNGRILVMLSGLLIESAKAPFFFENPMHPYSKDLLDVWSGKPVQQRSAFEKRGKATDLECPYGSQCRFAFHKCRQLPPLVHREGHIIRCWLYVS